MKTGHIIISGDSSQMDEIDKSVRVTIISPTCLQLKDYSSDKQTRFNNNFFNL
jgi:hypothetical protein